MFSRLASFEQRRNNIEKTKLAQEKYFDEKIVSRVATDFNNGDKSSVVFQDEAFPYSPVHSMLEWYTGSKAKSELKQLIQKIDPEQKFIDVSKSKVEYRNMYEIRNSITHEQFNSSYLFNLAFKN